jgi:very-short-patch-repair endonuclease
LGHRLLRNARIKGWQPNLPVLINGQVFYIDIAFKQQKLAIEIDGRLHETNEDLFESDRWRQNALVAGGWRVFAFHLRRCCVTTLTSSSARFSTHFTENTSRLCQNRTTRPFRPHE